LNLFPGSRPIGLGIAGGLLASVPARPNSVSSQATSSYHAIEPIVYKGTASAALASLLRHLGDDPQVHIVESRSDYVYAEFSSRWLGFVDDVEFYFVPTNNIIHVRSASRLGYRDFGVNRRRIELIRTWFVD
jgi:uncharacterized protein (DUF1499 family)